MSILRKPLDSSSDLRRAEQKRKATVESMLSLAKDEYRPSGSALESVSSSLTQRTGDRAGGIPGRRAVVKVGECANPECGQGWAARWRTQVRPVFEGKSACKGACLKRMVRAAISREGTVRRTAAVEAPHRHRVPLGLVMLAQGWITNPQLQKALAAQRAAGEGRIGDWLVKEGGLETERVTRGLGMQWNCPVLSGSGFVPERMALVLPRHFVEEYGVLPLRVAASHILYLGFQEYLDVSAAYAVERMTELPVERGVIASEEFETERTRLLTCPFPEVHSVALTDTDALVNRIAGMVEHRMPPQVKLVRLHQNYWLRVWKEPITRSNAGTLPAKAEDVIDYLFTIGSTH